MGKKKNRGSTPVLSSSPGDDRVDLVELAGSASATTDEEIVQLLGARHKAGLPYTRINSSSLVVVNPYQPLECMNDASAKDYSEQWYKNVSGNKPSLQPHIYELAARVFLHMRRSAEDQSVIFSGISGSGKSTSQTHFVKQLLLLSTHSKKESKISSQIQHVDTVLSAFGNAATVQNRNASRFGKYQELQFNERGRIVGAKTLTYALDKERVTAVPQDERTYHVFYWLLAGATSEERSTLHLQDANHYHYLSQSRCTRLADSDDSLMMGELRAALKSLGFKTRNVMQIWQLLSAILLLGNIEFTDPGKNSRDEAASVKNYHVLETISGFLGVSPAQLEKALTYKTKYIRRELCTMFLNGAAAIEQRDALARSLYSILFTWIVEHINLRLIQSDEPPNFVGLLDQPGSQNFAKNGFEQFAANFVTEEVENFVLKNIFEDSFGMNAELQQDGVSLPRIMTMDNTGCVELIRGDSSATKPGGLIGTLDQECAKDSVDDSRVLSAFQKSFGAHQSFVSNPPTKYSTKAGSFGINHFTGQVTYCVDGFVDKNFDTLSPDFVNLFRDTSSTFIGKLFSGPALAIENHPRNEKTVVAAQLTTKPMRAPSMKRKKAAETSEPEKADIKDADKGPAEVMTVVSQIRGTLNQLLETLGETRIWNVFQIRPNENHEPVAFDSKRVKAQVRSFLLPDVVARKKVEYTAQYTFADFLARYDSIIQSMNLEPTRTDRQKVEAFKTISASGQESMVLGRQHVFLADTVWKEFEDSLRASEKEERNRSKTRDDESLASGYAGEERTTRNVRKSATSSVDRLLPRGTPAVYAADYNNDDTGSYVSEDDYYSRSGGTGHGEEDDGALWGEWNRGGGGYTPPGDLKETEKDEKQAKEEIEEIPVTKTRIWWVRFVWLMTWWIPSFLLRWPGGMKRADVRMAWREKLTLCILIFLLSAVIIFYIVVFGKLICPNQDKAYSRDEVQTHQGEDDWWVSFRGDVYDLTNFWLTDHSDIRAYPTNRATMEPYAGRDVTSYFPLPLFQVCENLPFGSAPDRVTISKNITEEVDGPFYHTFGANSTYPGSDLTRPNWYTNQFLPHMRSMRIAQLVFDKKQVLKDGRQEDGRKWAIIGNEVFDLSPYFETIDVLGVGNQQDAVTNYHYLSANVETIFQSFPGEDVTARFNKIPPAERVNNLNCLKRIFKVGYVDFRKSFRCQFNNYILLVFSCILFAVITIKFLAALQLGSRRKPEDHDKFVICQVPCYTEGEESLKRTMDSLAALVYDDKRKLLFFIADGMIVGSGNDRPTPRILLDLLGVDPKLDPEPLAFRSIGESMAQLNMGKVYSGLYEYEGHVVPYMVVVKVGKTSEIERPGNRGKRDSQIILMRFLNKVHFDLEMSPLELEIYHQMKNVIGVHPSLYEYMLMVDADTEVYPDSLNRMISCMLHDGRIIGICGETTLVNEEGSWTTMMQVYEYYISHHLAKAFESLFGSVTCLPGCFCMYRIRTPVKSSPLIIANPVIVEYSENLVDTLHKKNLLSLGEDRYLTTLMMKHFPQYKMTFTPDAKCRTAAPDRWSVLLSQRRRWINSTIHNLLELMFLPEMCGFCCFSMRFVVFIDLFGTLILPSTVVYIAYLIYAVATERQQLPIIALVMLAAVYGLQAIIFILKRQWQHIGWMIIYLIAFPLYSFFIPVYAFWHFDDFSWGNTRVVVSDKKGKKQIITTDTQKFNESMIPMKKWADYEQEMWEADTSGSHESGVSRGSAATGYSYRSRNTRSEAGSAYGGSAYGGSAYGGSVYGGSAHGGGGGGGGDYFRDTNLAAPDQRRSRSRSPGPRYAPSNPRTSHYSVGDYMNEPRNSMLTRNTAEVEMVGRRPISSVSNVVEPTDDDVLFEIRNILATANLMSITKKQVRERLTAKFGVDMSSRKDLINDSIELILQGKL